MKLKITIGYLVAFVALLIAAKELHELSHIISGRLICGCWGAARDFNLISICEPCLQENPLVLIAAFAGPLFSYLCMWVGLLLMVRPNINQKWLGFALLFANKPFARLFTALVGGGDEYNAFMRLAGAGANAKLVQVFTIVVILAIILPPLVVAFKNIKNRRRVWWFVGFFFLPMMFDFVVVMKFFNYLLFSGVLATNFIFATPWLVHVVFWASLVTLLLFRKHLLLHPQNLKQRTTLDAGAVLSPGI